MFKTLLGDRETIENKYHKKDEPYDHFHRFDYHGYDYDPETGMDDTELKKQLAELSERLEGTPRPIHKAKLFAFVLDNTRIDVNEHDYFIGIYSWTRPLAPVSVNKWKSEVYNRHPEVAQIRADIDASGCGYGWLDFDHTVPDWESLCELGFPGILERAKNSYQALRSGGKLTEKQESFFRGIEIEYEAIIRLLDRLYRYAMTKSFDKAPIIAESLGNLRDGAPKTSFDVLQLIYIYFMLSESVDNYQVRSLGYGIDSTLYPYYRKDIESGKFTKEQIGEFIGYFLMQWSAIDNYWGQPVYLGGMTTDRKTKVNELSYLVLDVYDKLGLFNPKLQIKVNDTTPKDFVYKALEMVRHGVSSIVFINDDMIVKCLMAHGATYEEAVDSVISGCYEYKVKAKGIGISCMYMSALKPISLVFDNGFDTVSGKMVGIETGELETLDTFEKFYAAYLAQMRYVTTKFIEAFDPLEAEVHTINPSLMFSATISECVETMTDALDCGIENFSGHTLSGLGTAVDALMAVDQLVYKQKVVTLSQMKEALDKNWEGYEALRLRALALDCKFGNGNVVADNYGASIMRHFYDISSSRRNTHGGRYPLEMHSARAFVIHGQKTKATPDGRYAGDETSKNASPHPGSDRKGITALINSVTTLDTGLATAGFCLDAMLHPSAVQGEDGIDALYAVLNTYNKKNGQSIHFNIFDADTLRDAQKHPEKYKNLQVRVCGWNILWNNMAKKEQDAYIMRAENIAY